MHDRVEYRVQKNGTMRKVEYKIEYKTIRRRTKLRENFYLRLARHGPGTHRTSTAGLGPPPDVSPTTFIVALAPIRERLVESTFKALRCVQQILLTHLSMFLSHLLLRDCFLFRLYV